MQHLHITIQETLHVRIWILSLRSKTVSHLSEQFAKAPHPTNSKIVDRSLHKMFHCKYSFPVESVIAFIIVWFLCFFFTFIHFVDQIWKISVSKCMCRLTNPQINTFHLLSLSEKVSKYILYLFNCIDFWLKLGILVKKLGILVLSANRFLHLRR